MYMIYIYIYMAPARQILQRTPMKGTVALNPLPSLRQAAPETLAIESLAFSAA